MLMLSREQVEGKLAVLHERCKGPNGVRPSGELSAYHLETIARALTLLAEVAVVWAIHSTRSGRGG